MTTQNEDLSALGYTSSAPDLALGQPDVVKYQDEADLSTLEQVARLLTDRKKHYQSVNSLTLGDITIENQLIINKQMLFHVQELEGLIVGTIRKVREKHSEQR